MKISVRHLLYIITSILFTICAFLAGTLVSGIDGPSVPVVTIELYNGTDRNISNLKTSCVADGIRHEIELLWVTLPTRQKTEIEFLANGSALYCSAVASFDDGKQIKAHNDGRYKTRETLVLGN